MKQNIITGVAIVLLLGASLYGISRPVNVRVNVPQAQVLAGSNGTFHTNTEQFIDGVFITSAEDLDGTMPAIATGSALTAKIVCQNPVVDVNFPTTGQTLPLPSSSVMFDRGQGGCLSRIGYRKFFITNSSGSGNFTINISDSSATLRVVTVSTSSLAGVNGTSSLNSRDMASVEAVKHPSSSVNFLEWVVTVFR